MNEEKEKNNTIAITTFIIGVVPIIYILSIGPACFFNYNYSTSSSYAKSFRMFYAPVIWLHDNTPLKKPFENYVDIFISKP